MAVDEKIVSETLSLLKLYQQFGDGTSMHGIGRVLTNNSRWKRVLWSVMFLLGVAFAVYQFVLTMNDYYSYPVTTEVILQHEIMAKFPGVTICNLNTKRRSMISQDLQILTDEMSYESDEAPMDAIINGFIQSGASSDDKKSGHQLSDMLIKCVFNRRRCSEANFTRMTTVTYGDCYTFEITDPVLKYTTRAGPQNGLILELNIEQDQYLATTSKAGAKAIIHPTDEYPFPEDSGILALPGTVTSIEVKKGITHRLPAPYSNCVDASGQGSTQRNLFPNKKYMQKACMKSCYQLELYKKCNCCDADVPCNYYNIVNVDRTTTTTNETDTKVPFCETWDLFLCATNLENSFLKSELNCGERCPPSCDSTIFDNVVSSALWPAKSKFNGFLEFVNERTTALHNKSFADNASLELYVRSNFLRLEIFFDGLEFLEYTAYAKYDWNLLLGTIGGLLGLWLGFSLLTAMEIVEVLIDTLLYYIRRKHKEKMASQTEQN